MGFTMIEKILAKHSTNDGAKAGEIIDMFVDLRVTRDIGSAHVLHQLQEKELTIADPSKTFFTFDCNTPNIEPEITESQRMHRIYAKENGIKLFDVHSGIGSHLMIDQGLAVPGCTMVSGDIHVNLLGAIGALGQGMGEKDITAAFSKGKVWFRVPKTIKITLSGQLPVKYSAKDLALYLLSIFGSNKLLGCAVELDGEVIEGLSLDGRISLASMATEMGAVTFLMKPNQEVIDYCSYKSKKDFEVVLPDDDAEYEDELHLNIQNIELMIARPGRPFEVVPLEKLKNTGIDSAFIGTCTNGRIEDLRIAAGILKGHSVASGVILKIVPSTDEIWTQALQEGLIDIFKESGAIVADAGCGGCSSGRAISNGLGDVTISTGNRNFPGQIGRGDVYLSSPAVVAASAIAGFITHPDHVPDNPQTLFSFPKKEVIQTKAPESIVESNKPTLLEGKVWYIPFDNIDTDMIYHSRYTELSDSAEIGNRTFSHLSGYEDFASKVSPGDIVVTGNNFGLGGSRQQAVDCFKALGIQAIIARSFAVVYERNAINEGLPIIVSSHINHLGLQTGDIIKIDLNTGEISNTRNEKTVMSEKFSGIQMEIYQRGGLL
jgi:3-isopropylmalate/(R)-2-methylmalate dehydratase large subunit